MACACTEARWSFPPAMRAARHGRIVNVSSLSGSIGVPGLSVYSATKHALEGFSEELEARVFAKLQTAEL